MTDITFEIPTEEDINEIMIVVDERVVRLVLFSPQYNKKFIRRVEKSERGDFLRFVLYTYDCLSAPKFTPARNLKC